MVHPLTGEITYQQSPIGDGRGSEWEFMVGEAAGIVKWNGYFWRATLHSTSHSSDGPSRDEAVAACLGKRIQR